MLWHIISAAIGALNVAATEQANVNLRPNFDTLAGDGDGVKFNAPTRHSIGHFGGGTL